MDSGNASGQPDFPNPILLLEATRMSQDYQPLPFHRLDSGAGTGWTVAPAIFVRAKACPIRLLPMIPR